MPLTFSAGSSTVCSHLRVASDVFRLSFVPVSPAFRPFTPVSPAIRSFLPASPPVLRSYNVPMIGRVRRVQPDCVSKRGGRKIRTWAILTHLSVRNLRGGFCLFIYDTYAKYTRVQGEMDANVAYTVRLTEGITLHDRRGREEVGWNDACAKIHGCSEGSGYGE
jgi:hypothetical protein